MAPKNNEFKIKVNDSIKTDPFSQAWLSFSGPTKRDVTQLLWSDEDYYQSKFKIDLYRFLRDNIPLLNSCIYTWARLCSAPGGYEVVPFNAADNIGCAEMILENLSTKIHPFQFQKMAGLDSLLPLLFNSLFTDGAFAGYLVLNGDQSGIDKFQPVDISHIGSRADFRGERSLVVQGENGERKIGGEDFYYFGLNSNSNTGLGQSILSAIPFVAHIEQQLIDDMRRSTHNAGYHRLHVQITPPEKLSGESDNAYVNRVNEYFDETVAMIRECGPDDNPVTWDNVKVEYIGPRNVQGVTNSWFLNHRAMIEEICAGTNLAPFMLGYSYGTTHNWAKFKFDLVMRQVLSVQRQTARFLEWLGNIELALKGFNGRCRYRFDNALSYMADERAGIEKSKVDNIIRLYTAGLITKEEATFKAGELI
ncbi:MAG: hypothetical protein ABIJ45_09960 [Candidatus Zixiibacteriota bacterium]